MSSTAVADYVDSLNAPMREVAGRLVALVDAELPGAERLIWYGHPVWKVAGEPAVLVKACSRHVMLGFWRGRAIDSDGGLIAGGGPGGMASVKVSGDVPAGAGAWLRQVPALHPAA
jgi:hypothetical protein